MIRYMNGFDHYTNTLNAAISTVAPEAFSGAGVFNQIPSFTGRAAVMEPSSYSTAIPPLTPLTGIVPVDGETLGYCFFFFQEAADSAHASFCEWRSSFSGLAVKTLTIDNSNYMSLKIGSDQGTVLATSASAITSAVIHHCEIQVTFGNPGRFVLRVDGVEQFDWSGSFPASESTYFSFVRNNGALTNEKIYVDDFVIYDKTGDFNNDWMGERKIYHILPNEDISGTWAPNGAASVFETQNNLPPSGSQYAQALNAGEEMVMGLSPLLVASVGIAAIQVESRLMKTTSGDASTQIGIETEGVRLLSTARTQTLDQYKYERFIIEQNPNTGTIWSPIDIADLRVVLKRV